MRTGKAARALLRVLAVLAALAAVAALDWYPTVKELGRLRRERGDMERKIKEYGAMAARFNFPDEAEKSILTGARAELIRALPLVENDFGWGPIGVFDLESRVRADNIPHARFLFNFDIRGLGLGTSNRAGEEPLKQWIGQEFWNIQAGFALANVPGPFPWRDIFPGLDPRRGWLAARTACVVALAPLPVLLGFINHLTWGDARLEIVRLRLEPGTPNSRAWIVVRGHFLAGFPSARDLRPESDQKKDLLIDADSPLLWQKANPLFAPAVEKRELPPAGSPW
jgi:hypothetical protein